jgi:hypothetical protein
LQARVRQYQRKKRRQLFFFNYFQPLSLVSQAGIMPICQNISVSTSHANVTWQPEQPCKATTATMAGNITSNPAIATPNPATIDAVTLCEVINLTNPIPIHGESLPAFRPDSCHTSSPIRSNAGTLYTTPRARTRTLLYLPATGSVSIGAGGQGISLWAGARRRWRVGVCSQDCRLKP